MTTHNANNIHGKVAGTEGHNGGLHLSCNGVDKERMSKEKESIKSNASNGTCIMAIGNKSSNNNHQRYLVTEQQNGQNGLSQSADENKKEVSPKPKPPPSPKKDVSTKVDPKSMNDKKSPKKKKKKRKFRLGLGVRQRVDYGKLDKFNSRMGLTTGILQLVLSLEAVTLGALQSYFLPEYAETANVYFVWPSIGLCILSGIFGTWSHRKGTYVVYLYMLVSIFACITSCMMFGLEVHTSKQLRKMCSTADDVTAMNVTETMKTDCQKNYGLNMAISVILSIIALFQILISFVAAIGSSSVMCSLENHEILVDECLSDDDDGEPPPPNAGLPQIRRAANRR